MQGRRQVARRYNMTDDRSVKDMLSFLLARDTVHQNQWLAAIEQLKTDGLETLPVPSKFLQAQENSEVSYQFLSFSDGTGSRNGPWASGPSIDGRGEFSFLETPDATGEVSSPPKADPRLYATVTPDWEGKAMEGGLKEGLLDKVKNAVE